MNHNVKLDRNLKIIRYRFENIYNGRLRKINGKIMYGYQKLANLFNIDKAAVIRICKKRIHWLVELKKLSKQYLSQNEY